jgi:hypothetical protein
MNPISTTTTVEMKNAKKFLRENPTESKAVAARIFNVNVNSLITFIRRGSGQKNEGQNKRRDWPSKKRRIERKSHVLKNQ